MASVLPSPQALSATVLDRVQARPEEGLPPPAVLRSLDPACAPCLLGGVGTGGVPTFTIWPAARVEQGAIGLS